MYVRKADVRSLSLRAGPDRTGGGAAGRAELDGSGGEEAEEGEAGEEILE